MEVIQRSVKRYREGVIHGNRPSTVYPDHCDLLQYRSNAAILALSEIPKNDASLCERHGVPIIERDLSVSVIDGASADE